MVNLMINKTFRELSKDFGLLSNGLTLHAESTLLLCEKANTTLNIGTSQREGIEIHVTQFDGTRFCDVMFEQTNIYCPDVIAHSINKRKAEYFVGRYLVANRLNELGFEYCTLESNIDRSPRFPCGAIGSISHCTNLACVVVTPSCCPDRENLGLDVQELISSDVCRDIESMIVAEQEVDLAVSVELTKEQAITLLFSAKEAIYKALAKFSTRGLNFTDAKLKQINQKTMEFELSESIKLRTNTLKEISCEYWYLAQHKAFLTLCYYSRDC